MDWLSWFDSSARIARAHRLAVTRRGLEVLTVENDEFWDGLKAVELSKKIPHLEDEARARAHSRARAGTGRMHASRAPGGQTAQTRAVGTSISREVTHAQTASLIAFCLRL